MKNYRQTLHAQFANSPTLVALIDRFNDWIDPTADLDAFYQYLWNVETARGFGLDFWGKVVDISRYLQVDQSEPTFGFYEAWSGSTIPVSDGTQLVINQLALVLRSTAPVTGDPNVQPFDQAMFYDGPEATQTYRLTDDAYRKLIYAKAFSNISDCTIPSLNYLLRYLFGSGGRCFVQSTGGMRISFMFEFELSSVELAMLRRSNAILLPAGVEMTQITQMDPDTTFGFAEGGGQPFDNGVFLNESQVTYAVN